MVSITKLHIELTTKCNARCWEFLDPDSSVCLHGGAKNKDIDVNSLKNFLTNDVLSKITDVKLCGSLGEPTLHPRFLEIIEHIKYNPGIKISLSTNGDTHNPLWWHNLGSLLNSNDVVYFGIDGLEDTLPLYRGTSFTRIIKNLKGFKTFSKAKAEWQYIVFQHNEHQIEESQRIADDLGIDLDLRESGEYSNNLKKPIYTAFTEANTEETHSLKEGYLFIGVGGKVFPGHFTRILNEDIYKEAIKYKLDTKTFLNLLIHSKALDIAVSEFDMIVEIMEKTFEDKIL